MSEILSSTKLPSKKEVMALFFYYKEATKQTVREASHSTTNDVLEVWAKARIPTRLKKHVVEKVECLFHEYDKLKKNKENKAKRSESLLKKEEEWKDGLESLFDITHADAMKMISMQEDREFLLARREAGRRGKMGSVDKAMAKRERVEKKTSGEEKREKNRTEWPERRKLFFRILKANRSLVMIMKHLVSHHQAQLQRELNVNVAHTKY